LPTLPTDGTSSPDPDDRTIRIWDAETGDAVGKPLEGHTDGWCGLLLTLPDGRYIISGSGDKPFESGMPRQVMPSVNL
jgi:WD40 repeat protein